MFVTTNNPDNMTALTDNLHLKTVNNLYVKYCWHPAFPRFGDAKLTI